MFLLSSLQRGQQVTSNQLIIFKLHMPALMEPESACCINQAEKCNQEFLSTKQGKEKIHRDNITAESVDFFMGSYFIISCFIQIFFSNILALQYISHFFYRHLSVPFFYGFSTFFACLGNFSHPPFLVLTKLQGWEFAHLLIAHLLISLKSNERL